MGVGILFEYADQSTGFAIALNKRVFVCVCVGARVWNNEHTGLFHFWRWVGLSVCGQRSNSARSDDTVNTGYFYPTHYARTVEGLTLPDTIALHAPVQKLRKSYPLNKRSATLPLTVLRRRKFSEDDSRRMADNDNFFPFFYLSLFSSL